MLNIEYNIKHITLTINQKFYPRKTIKININHTLITTTKKNIRNYISNKSTNIQKYPISNPINYNPISAPTISNNSQNPTFPTNITFIQIKFPY